MIPTFRFLFRPALATFLPSTAVRFLPATAAAREFRVAKTGGEANPGERKSGDPALFLEVKPMYRSCSGRLFVGLACVIASLSGLIPLPASIAAAQAAAARGQVVNLDDPQRIHADWPEGAGVSVSLPAADAFAWPPDRAFRELVMDETGAGGSLFTRGDFGAAPGGVGLKMIFRGGPVRKVGATPTVCYLGGEGPGQDSRHQLRLNAIEFKRTGCETGVVGAHRLVLQADVEVAFQTHTGGQNIPRLQLFSGGIDTDVREVGLNGHRLAFLGGKVIAGIHGGISSYGGIDLGGGSLEFHDFAWDKQVFGAGFSDGSTWGPGPTGPTKEATNLYLRGEGTLRWQTLSQQCLSPQDPASYGRTMGPFARWDTSRLTIEIDNNRYRPGVTEWEVWSDGQRLKIGTMRVGGAYGADIRMVDRWSSTAGAGNEQLRVGGLEVAGKGHLECDGIAVKCDTLVVNGKTMPVGVYPAASLAPGITDRTGRTRITVGDVKPDAPKDAVAKATITLDRPGRVSVGIFDGGGTLLRNLTFGEQRPAGEMRIEWDGLDDLGRPMPAGAYEWRALSRPGFRASLVTVLGLSHPESIARCWGGNHRGPETVTSDKDGIYVGFPGSEFTGQVLALRPDGTRRWSVTNQDFYAAAPEAIASDGAGRIAVLSYEGGSALSLSIVSAANGSNGGAFPVGVEPAPKQWGWCGNVNMAAREGVAVVSYRSHDLLRWISLDGGKELARASLAGSGSLTFGPDSSVWVLAKDGVFRCERGGTPAKVWPTLRLDQPRAIAWDAVAGSFLIAEGGTQQVLRVSSDGKELARFGRAGGRVCGPWIGSDFRGLFGVTPDGSGGFVTVEAGNSAVNRTARFDAGGKLLAEWFGGQRWGHGIALDPEDPTLATIEGGTGMLCLVRIDPKTRTWKMLESFEEPNTDSLFRTIAGFGKGWELRRHGGKLWYVHADPTSGASVYEIDRANGRLFPRAVLGRMDLRKEQAALWVEALALSKPATPPSGFVWSDKNLDGRMAADEVMFGVFGFEYGSSFDLSPDWTITVATADKEHAWITIPNLNAADPSAAPRWDLAARAASKAAYPEQVRAVDDFGIRPSGDALLRDGAGNTYQLLVGHRGENEDRQGEFWPEFYGAAVRVVKWDASGRSLWAVGRHIGGLGRFTCNFGLLGVVQGNIIARDRYGIPTSVWSGEGLYAGNLMEEVVTDHDTPWVWDYWNGHADSMMEYDQTFNGLWSYPDGSVYYGMQGRSGTPLFRIEGWNDWTRLKGKMVLSGTPKAAASTGAGLRAEYFATPDLTGAPVLTRTDPRVWFEATPGITGGMIPATWGNGAPAQTIPADHFSARWTGEIEARFSEDYRFIVESDPSSRVKVWLGDRLVIDDDGTADRHAARIDREHPCRRNHSPSLRLESGKRYPLRIEYAHDTGNAGIHLMWESRTQERQHVPAGFLHE